MKKITLSLFLHMPFVWFATSCGDNSTSSANGTHPKVVQWKQSLERMLDRTKSKRREIKILKEQKPITSEDQYKFLEGCEILEGECEELAKLNQEVARLNPCISSKEQKEIEVLAEDFKQEAERLKEEIEVFKRF